jgi:hypothetical protein
MGANILCIGLNNVLMKTRTLILEKAGHKVTQACDLRQVDVAGETNSLAVAILGQSLNSNEKMRIADVILTRCDPHAFWTFIQASHPNFLRPMHICKSRQVDPKV